MAKHIEELALLILRLLRQLGDDFVEAHDLLQLTGALSKRIFASTLVRSKKAANVEQWNVFANEEEITFEDATQEEQIASAFKILAGSHRKCSNYVLYRREE